MLFRSFPAILLTITSLLVLNPAERPALAQAPASDPQGAALLQQVLNVSGATLNPIRAFTAHGTITYFWAGQPVQGSATIRALGIGQFRLDANMPDGPRSFSTSRRGGNRKEPDGKLTDIPAHNTASAGVLTLPYPAIATYLADPAVSVSYLGQMDSGGRQTHQARVTRNLPEEADPDGILAAFFRNDYFIDAESYRVIRIEGTTHPVESMLETYAHVIELEGYSTMGGIAVPTVVREKVAGQVTWELRLSDISFNPDLRDSDFSLQ